MAVILAALLLLTMLVLSICDFPARASAATPRPRIPLYRHAADFSWVTGRLERSHLEGGFWVLHYQAPGARRDANGGQLVLRLPARLEKSLRDGEPVRLHGRLRPDLVGIQMAGPLYEVTRVEPLDRR